MVEPLEEAFPRCGPPRHLITGQEGVFTGEAFAALLRHWGIQQRLGAVGRHGSIAVTERVTLTLKYEWPKRVPVIRGIDHLGQLLRDFVVYHNEHRGHETLGGAVPAVVGRGERWTSPEKSAKTPPADIERRSLADSGISAYRPAA